MLGNNFQEIIQVTGSFLLSNAVNIHSATAGGRFQPGQTFQRRIVKYGISRNPGLPSQFIPQFLQLQKQILVKLSQGSQISRRPDSGLLHRYGYFSPAGKRPNQRCLLAPHHHFIAFRTQGNQGTIRISAHSGQSRHLHGTEQLADIVLAPSGKDAIGTQPDQGCS